MQSKKDDKQTKYEFGVCVKETNNENGSGHVSAFTRKTKEGKSTVTHTSFFPSALGGILQRFSLGSIPTSGELAKDHIEDLTEANKV